MASQDRMAKFYSPESNIPPRTEGDVTDIKRKFGSGTEVHSVELMDDDAAHAPRNSPEEDYPSHRPYLLQRKPVTSSISGSTIGSNGGQFIFTALPSEHTGEKYAQFSVGLRMPVEQAYATKIGKIEDLLAKLKVLAVPFTEDGEFCWIDDENNIAEFQRSDSIIHKDLYNRGEEIFYVSLGLANINKLKSPLTGKHTVTLFVVDETEVDPDAQYCWLEKNLGFSGKGSMIARETFVVRALKG